MNGITAGNDSLSANIGGLISRVFGTYVEGLYIRGWIGNESYHPSAYGHELYADALIAQTNSLTAPMPEATPTPTPLPNSDFFSLAATQQAARVAQKDYRVPITESQAVEIVDFLRESQQLHISSPRLMPNSMVEVELHSDPVSLGQYSVDPNGVLDAQVILPDNTQPGVHQIHVLGHDRYGNTVDYYTSFYLGHSATDFDGDGITNDLDMCMTVQNSGVDEDNDGIDDVCDGLTEIVVEPEPDNHTNNRTKGKGKKYGHLIQQHHGHNEQGEVENNKQILCTIIEVLNDASLCAEDVSGLRPLLVIR